MADCCKCKWAEYERDAYAAYVGEQTMQLSGCFAPDSYGNLERFFDGCGTDFDSDCLDDCPAFLPFGKEQTNDTD